MKRPLVLVLIFVLGIAASTLHAQHSTATATSAVTPPRYQLFAATVQAATMPAPDLVIIKIDTQTGKTWLFLNTVNRENTAWIHGWSELPDVGVWQNPAPFGTFVPQPTPKK